jgi:hypothetical protein
LFMSTGEVVGTANLLHVVIPVVLTAVAAYLVLRVRLRIVGIQLATANKELERVSALLDLERNLPTADKIKSLLEQLGCFGSAICAEIACFRLYSTFEDANAGLSELKSKFAALPSPPPGVFVTWVLDRLARLVDDRLPSLAGDAQERQAYRTAVACYAHAVAWRLDDPTLRAAVAHCRSWLNRRRTRLDVAGSLLPALLNSFPQDRDVFGIAEKIIFEAHQAKTQEEQDVVAAVIHALARCSALSPPDMLRLLELAFRAATANWQGYGDAWHLAMRQCLQNQKYRKDPGLGLLGDVLGSYVIGAGMHILSGSDRADEYNAIVSLLADIRSRPMRPRNRHVIQGEDIVAEIAFQDGGRESAIGQLINFSLGEGRWMPGAFVRAGGNAGSSARYQWRTADVLVRRPGGAAVRVASAEVWGPEAEPRGTLGFRLKFSGLADDALSFFEGLANDYPLTR